MKSKEEKRGINKMQNLDNYSRILNAPSYSMAEISRLVGVNPWTVRRYLRGYEYDYINSRTIQPPVVKSDTDDRTIYASFLDLIDLIFVREFMRRGFGLPTLRKALDEARERLGTPHFARSVFFTSGSKEIILKLPQNGSMIALLTGGQSAMPQIIEMLSDKLEFEDVTGYGFVKRWYPRGVQGLIVIDPEISFGRPTLKGRAVPTHNIYDLYLGEKKKIAPVSNWFRIPAPEIDAAIKFEQHLWA
jgi:uncharacterized protein (DUF433 family)